jgi:predicted SAM-dependent methyltransferase
VNIDNQDLPGVDVVADVTGGLQFADSEAVFAEHFLEHLGIDQALDFLDEAHRVLADGGTIRLTTPNLDWVWATHYHPQAEPDTKREMAIQLNRAFHGWEHQFLWNREMLGEALEAAGFVDLDWPRRGESRFAVYQGIERHEAYDDLPDMQHVLVVDAVRGPRQPERMGALRERIARDFLAHMKG